MDTFLTYFRLGLEHITDLAGYDHILFVTALCAVYRFGQWRPLVWLVTAFTLGHSVALALSVLRVVNVDSGLIEFLIPVTIAITCGFNLLTPGPESAANSRNRTLKYVMAAGFGIIHGLGFSNYLRELLGQQAGIAAELLAFNLGLEAGQLAIVLVILVLAAIFDRTVPTGRVSSWRAWNVLTSVVIATLAVQLMIDKYPF